MSTRNEKANAIRALSMDAVQKANSGHPGMPMGMADIAEVLWSDYLKHNPQNPDWFDRDRFVLSNGHGSMLLYSLLHLSGYDLSIDDLRDFRQLHSKTPGHPEYGMTPGVETTTGPLGQGLAMSVGMALAEKMLAARFNTKEHQLVDHHTYVFAGDGCLMEGVSHEACSLAGTLGLGKLIVFYDDNGISIDGKVEGWFTDDTPKRFEAYGWHVVANVDGHDPEALKQATEAARAETDRPTLICCKTTIGFGSPNLAGTAKSHGAPLGDDEIALVRGQIGWSHPPFEIPTNVYEAWSAKERGAALEAQWDGTWKAYQTAYPEKAAEFQRRMDGTFPDGWEEAVTSALQVAQDKGDKKATRAASLTALNALAPVLPELVGGSADLTGSNKTLWSGSTTVTGDTPDGNYIYYGVREFAMTAMLNGLTLHGGFIPYAGTFLVFSDYARNALRLSALMKIQSIHVYTHDSIGLGEDGPTHQPVEHVASLRLIPNMTVWRPCDVVETVAAWKDAIERKDGPTCLALSRQGLPHQQRDAETLRNVQRGGYVLKDCEGTPQLILMGTGSEVQIAVEAADQLATEGIDVRVVSMPSMEVFEAQDEAYKNTVLPPEVEARVAIEAGVVDSWYRYVGYKGRCLGMESFGESAPANVLYQHFGLTVEALIAEAKGLL
ncbi:MAG TPA: transketolase [Myxococcales bacterium]|nr:transketolase [Deltaproteobacteria bacterium]MBU54165.1 transketolase [Deltaproteobacteria bacterium]HAA54586.1 transketolase [Myxococcales bacterium]|tara:strand:- start:4853 stop:6847 length:1995 start_codon:yes stop_codon:yes gene_type:complete